MSKAVLYCESVNKNGSPGLQECNKTGLHKRDGAQLMEANVLAKNLSCAQRTESLRALTAELNGPHRQQATVKDNVT